MKFCSCNDTCQQRKQQYHHRLLFDMSRLWEDKTVFTGHYVKQESNYCIIVKGFNLLSTREHTGKKEQQIKERHKPYVRRRIQVVHLRTRQQHMHGGTEYIVVSYSGTSL
eukprot:scpid102624/ scgid14323/ 